MHITLHLICGLASQDLGDNGVKICYQTKKLNKELESGNVR